MPPQPPPALGVPGLLPASAARRGNVPLPHMQIWEGSPIVPWPNM